MPGVEWGRSHLDIITDSESKIDLLFVMLNPGSCSCTKTDLERVTEEVQPDPTLKRIITLLQSSSRFKNCRVLNLSDIKEHKSKTFFEKNHLSFSEYSIFSEHRNSELNSLISSDMKAILAWGKKVQNSDSTKNVINKLKGLNVQILNENQAHYHPLVRIKDYKWSLETSKFLSYFS